MATKLRTARKAHTCSDCGTTINPGDQYQDQRLRRRLGVAIRYCLSCANIKLLTRIADTFEYDDGDKGGSRNIIMAEEN
jgi:RNase P subunit RPR2